MKAYHSLLLADMEIDAPMQVVSAMAAFWAAGKHWDPILCMYLFNDEMVAHAISSKRGDRNVYIDGLNSLMGKKKEGYAGLSMILYSD